MENTYTALDHLRFILRRLANEGCGTAWAEVRDARKYLDDLRSGIASDVEDNVNDPVDEDAEDWLREPKDKTTE